MLGAIVGDIVGSRFEFNNHRSKDFEMFHRDCEFTDDTVMTVAVAKALMMGGTPEAFRRDLIIAMHEFGQRYPYAGYGARFGHWIFAGKTQPYNSYGNGSAMRVSPVAWYAKTLEECEELAKISAEVTHNHPEGIKGAICTAGAIFIARTTKDMDAVKAYVAKHYTIGFTLDEIRPTYRFNETCQETVPQAMQAFFESKSFKDAIRNAISVGGDSDTLAAITGSVAEAFYGIPEEMKEKAFSYLDGYLADMTQKFITKYTEKGETTMKKNDNNITELVFILDRSGSMSGLESDTIGGFNAMIEKQKQEAGECYVSTILFDNVSEVLHDRVKLSEIKPMTREQYTVRGCTALIDAIGGAIRHIANIHKYARPEDVPAHTVFVITTDGMENASRKYTAERVKRMIEHEKEKYGWEFLFIGANIDAVETAARYGIGSDRAVNYHADSKGTEVLYESVSEAVRYVRDCGGIQPNWTMKIDSDYKARGKKNR